MVISKQLTLPFVRFNFKYLRIFLKFFFPHSFIRIPSKIDVSKTKKAREADNFQRHEWVTLPLLILFHFEFIYKKIRSEKQLKKVKQRSHQRRKGFSPHFFVILNFLFSALLQSKRVLNLHPKPSIFQRTQDLPNLGTRLNLLRRSANKPNLYQMMRQFLFSFFLW